MSIFLRPQLSVSALYPREKTRHFDPNWQAEHEFSGSLIEHHTDANPQVLIVVKIEAN